MFAVSACPSCPRCPRREMSPRSQDSVNPFVLKHLVVVSGYTGAGKSTMAEAIATDIGASVVSFDWIMSGLRSFPEVWSHVETPVERQRSVGWALMSRVGEQQLRAGRSVVFDLVARSAALIEWMELAERNEARLSVVECVCSDPPLQLARIAGRNRQIPGWYELTSSDVERSRARYQPLPDPKVVVDSVNPLSANVEIVLRSIRGAPVQPEP